MIRKKPSAAPPQSEPIAYGAGTMDYQDYLKVPDLLSLQRPRSDPPHHDEMLFIIIHQAYELWFKLMIHEAEMVIRHLQRDAVEGAQHHVQRIVAIMQVLVRQIHLLETMKPVDFLEFRDHLKPASGFQSVQFRELEFLAGLKETAYLRFFEGRDEPLRTLRARLREPDLGEAFVQMLGRLGYPVPRDATNAAMRNDPSVMESVARALVPLYQRPETNMPLYLLCERLLELDESFSLWRNHHVYVVERIIGAKTGTGGSSGVPYLRSTTTKRSFPFLWEVRTYLERPAPRPQAEGKGKRGRRRG